MRRDVCHYYEKGLREVFDAYYLAATQRFGKDCKIEPLHTLTFGLNYSIKYSMNGGACTIHFMPYQTGTAVDIRYSLAQLGGARIKAHDKDLSDYVVGVLQVPPQDCNVQIEEFLRPENQVTIAKAADPKAKEAAAPDAKPESEVSKVAVRFCWRCGAHLDGEYAFCPKCGGALSADAAQAAEPEMEDVVEEEIPEPETEQESEIEEPEEVLSEPVEEAPEMVLEPEEPKPVIRFCRHCGANLDAEYTFCPKCGGTLKAPEAIQEEPAATPKAETIPEPEAIPESEPEPFSEPEAVEEAIPEPEESLEEEPATEPVPAVEVAPIPETPLVPKFCRHCGAPLEKLTPFCPQCGGPLK